MHRSPCSSRGATWLGVAAALLLMNAVQAQQPATSGSSRGPQAGGAGGTQAISSPPTVLGLRTFNLVVANLDKSVQFYRDVIGLDLLMRGTSSDVARDAVTNTPGAKLRYAVLRIPNEVYAIELDEYSGVERTAVQANHNDPGSTFINFGVLDATKGFAVLRAAHPTLVGRSSKIPSSAAIGRMATVWIRDPDGHLIEYMQGGWDPQRKSLWGLRNVYRSHFGVTMEKYQQALSFYRDLLGFDLTPMLQGGQYISMGPLAADLGLPLQVQLTGVGGHCATARCEMFEFKDAPGTAFHPPLQDPGAAYLSMWVSDLDALLDKLKAAGDEIVTAGGSPVVVKLPREEWVAGYDTLPPVPAHSSRQVMVRDPAGFPVLLMQRVD